MGQSNPQATRTRLSHHHAQGFRRCQLAASHNLRRLGARLVGRVLAKAHQVGRAVWPIRSQNGKIILRDVVGLNDPDAAVTALYRKTIERCWRNLTNDVFRLKIRRRTLRGNVIVLGDSAIGRDDTSLEGRNNLGLSRIHECKQSANCLPAEPMLRELPLRLAQDRRSRFRQHRRQESDCVAL